MYGKLSAEIFTRWFEDKMHKSKLWLQGCEAYSIRVGKEEHKVASVSEYTATTRVVIPIAGA